MRRIKYLGIALMAILFGCESPDLSNLDDSDDPQANLKVSIYQMGSTPFTALTRAVDNCTRINYAVYTTSGTRVKQVNQEVGDDHFGTAYFQLPEGDYQVVVVAHSSGGNPTRTDPTKIQFKNAQGFTDTFLYSHEVTQTDQQQVLDVSLNRIVSLCRFVITDDYPEQVAKMRFHYTGGSGAFNAYTGLGSVNSKQEMTFQVADGQKAFDLYTFLHDTEGTLHLTVTALDAQDLEVDEREYDIPLTRNLITKVSAPYFDTTPQGMSIDIQITTDWDGEIEINF